jgi:hypothetical protein
MTPDHPDATPMDASGSAPELAQHLANCSPCRAELDILAAQRDVLTRVGNRPVKDGEHLVARVLRVAAEEGNAKLADLLYMMARACVIAAPPVVPADEAVELDPTINPPVPIEGLRPQFDAMARRASTKPNSALPTSTPSLERALEDAELCLRVLERLEGMSARRRYFEARIATRRGDSARVIDILTPMCSESLPRALWLAVRWHLSAAYLRSQRPSEAVDVCSEALKVCPEDHALLLNRAVADAALGNGERALEFCDRFSSSTEELQGGYAWWHATVEETADWLATQLEMDRSIVTRRLTLPAKRVTS